jgi:hypothetical protein
MNLNEQHLEAIKHWKNNYDARHARQFWKRINHFDVEFLEQSLIQWKSRFGEINSLFYIVGNQEIIWLDHVFPRHDAVFHTFNEIQLTFFKDNGLVILDSALLLERATKVGNLSQVQYLYENYLKGSKFRIYNSFYPEEYSLNAYHRALNQSSQAGQADIVAFLADKMQNAESLEQAFYNTLQISVLRNNFPNSSYEKTVHVLYSLIEGYYELTGKNIVDSCLVKLKNDYGIDDNHKIKGITPRLLNQEMQVFNKHFQKLDLAYQMVTKQLADSQSQPNDSDSVADSRQAWLDMKEKD